MKFLKKEWDSKEITDWNKDQKRNFVEKTKKFVILNDGLEGSWSHGEVLHIVLKKKRNSTPSGYKMIVPPNKKQHVLKLFHENNGDHYGKIGYSDW